MPVIISTALALVLAGATYGGIWLFARGLSGEDAKRVISNGFLLGILALVLVPPFMAGYLARRDGWAFGIAGAAPVILFALTWLSWLPSAVLVVVVGVGAGLGQIGASVWKRGHAL